LAHRRALLLLVHIYVEREGKRKGSSSLSALVLGAWGAKKGGGGKKEGPNRPIEDLVRLGNIRDARKGGEREKNVPKSLVLASQGPAPAPPKLRKGKKKTFFPPLRFVVKTGKEGRGERGKKKGGACADPAKGT